MNIQTEMETIAKTIDERRATLARISHELTALAEKLQALADAAESASDDLDSARDYVTGAHESLTDALAEPLMPSQPYVALA